MTRGPHLVSVITVVRNGERNLEGAMASVFEQDYEPIEYVVVDGGSTDGTLEIVHRYKDRLAWWVSEPDSGIFDAMNKGIAHTKGRLVKLLNADDRLTPGSIGTAVDRYVAAGEIPAVIASDVLVVDAHGRALKRMGRPPASDPVPSVLHPSWYVDRRVYEQNGMYATEYRIGADFEMTLRLLDRGIPFLFTEDALVEFRSGGASSKVTLAIRERYRIMRCYYPRRFALRALVSFAYRKLRHAALVHTIGETRTFRLRSRLQALGLRR